MPADLTGSSPRGAGIHVLGGVELTPALLRWLRDVRQRLTFDIVVTSGVRTPEAQARAWKTKIDLGYTVKDFEALYRRDDLVQEVFRDSDLSVEGMARVFAAQVARGDFLSSHLTARALDLRTRGLTPGELGALRAAVTAVGGRTVLETRPPHLHVEAYGLTDRREPSTTTRTWTAPRG